MHVYSEVISSVGLSPRNVHRLTIVVGEFSAGECPVSCWPGIDRLAHLQSSFTSTVHKANISGMRE